MKIQEFTCSISMFALPLRWVLLLQIRIADQLVVSMSLFGLAALATGAGDVQQL
jgi:hypothetical protein